jgi:hypothetical protein
MIDNLANFGFVMTFVAMSIVAAISWNVVDIYRNNPTHAIMSGHRYTGSCQDKGQTNNDMADFSDHFRLILIHQRYKLKDEEK